MVQEQRTFKIGIFLLVGLILSYAKVIGQTSAFSAQISGQNVTSACASTAITFTNTSTTATSNLSWNFGDGYTVTNVASISHSYSAKGTYTVRLTNNTNNQLIGSMQLTIFSNPAASFSTSSNSVCAGSSITFTSTSQQGSANITQYQWTLGDGYATSTNTPTLNYTYNNSGVYSPILIVTDANGCKGSDTSSSTIKVDGSGVTPQFTANGTDFYSCTNAIDLANTTNENSKTGITYTWDFGDGQKSYYKNPGAHTYSAVGVYTVKLQAGYSGNTGCAPSYVKTVYIGSPSISITSASQICQNAELAISAKVSPTGFLTSSQDLTWSATEGGINSNNGTAIFYTAGTRILSVKNNNGCPTTVSKNINVLEQPNLTLNLTPNSGICIGTQIDANVITNNGITVNKYVWFPNGLNNTASDTTKTNTYLTQYATAGSYQFGVTATSSQGCTSAAAQYIAVNEKCIDNGAGSAYNPIFSFTSESCDNKYNITLVSKVPGKTVSYWEINNQKATAHNNQATILIANATKGGVYDVITHYSDGSVSASMAITIIDEVAGFDINSSENEELYCATNNITFSAANYVNSQNIGAYAWTITSSDGTVVNTGNAISLTYAFLTSGTYTISLQTTDISSNACISTMTKTITVKGLSADFSADKVSFCYNNPSVTFTSNIALGNSPLTNVLWQYGDQVQDTIQSPAINGSVKHTYNAPTTSYNEYVVQLTATDADGCTSTKTYNNYIRIFQPKVSFSAQDTLLCKSNSIKFYNLSSAQETAYYEWNIGGHVVNTTNKSDINFSLDNITKPDHFDVSLKVTDAGGCTSDTTIYQYIKFRTPKAKFVIANDSLFATCPPYTLTLLNQSTNTDSLQWQFNSTQINQLRDTIYYTVLHPGELNLKLTAHLDGCEDSESLERVIKGPIASLILKDTIGCAPYTSEMVLDHNDDIVSYQWNFGDGNSQLSTTLDKTSYIYTRSGTYTPYVIVAGKEGCTDNLQYGNPIIVGTPKAAFKISDSSKLCYYDSIAFLNQSSYDNSYFKITKLTWHWNNEIQITDTIQTIRHLFKQEDAPHRVYLTATTAYCDVNSDTLQVTPYLVPSVAIQGTSFICLNDSIRLAGLSSNTENYNNTYAWYYDSSLIQSSKDSLLLAPYNTSLQNINLTVTSEKGCSTTVSKALDYVDFPTVSINKDIAAFCTGGSLQLQAQSNAATYLWTSVKAIAQATTLTPTVTPDSSANYYLTVTDANNCKNYDTILVMVDQKVNLKLPVSFTYCLNDTVPLMLNTQTDNVSRFLWTAIPQNGYMSSDSTASTGVIPTETTTYHVIAYSGSSCPDESGDILVTGLPFSALSFNPNALTESAGNTVTLSPIVTNEDLGVKYYWTPNNHIDNVYLKNPQILVDNNIVYKLRITNDNGCTAADSITISVPCTDTKIYMANAFTPNADGVNDRFYVTGYGISKVNSFVIFDRWGKKVFEKNNIAANDIRQGWDGTIDGKPAATATYIYMGEIECNEGRKTAIKGSVVLIR